MNDQPIFKICRRAEWDDAARGTGYSGSAKDRADGFLHFSTAEQLAGTLARYYADVHDIVLVAVDPNSLGSALKFEPSRDGALFPHLYGVLPMAAVLWVEPVRREPAGGFILPGAID